MAPQAQQPGAQVVGEGRLPSQKAEGAGTGRHTGARGKARATGARFGQVRRGSSNDSGHGRLSTLRPPKCGIARQLEGTSSACSRDKGKSEDARELREERCTSGPPSEHGLLPIFPSRRALSGHKLGPCGGRGMERLGRDAINTARCGKGSAGGWPRIGCWPPRRLLATT